METIGVIASVIATLATIITLIFAIRTSRQSIRRRIARKQRKISELDREIFLLGRNPLAFMQTEQLKMKQVILREEIVELQQYL